MLNNSNNNSVVIGTKGGNSTYGMASNMGVAWFHQATPALVQSPSFKLSRYKSDNENNNNLNTLNNKANKRASKPPEDDGVDVIDIEDEDHSFAAFFIGMKAGPARPYVKRPLVHTREPLKSCHKCTYFYKRSKLEQLLINLSILAWGARTPP